MARLAGGALQPRAGRSPGRLGPGPRIECRRAERVEPPAAESPPRPARPGPLQLAVSAATEGLRLAGVGRSSTEEGSAAAALAPLRPLRRGDVRGVLAAIRADYGRAYFVTGVIDDRVYAEDCLFADPTISFTGRDLWKRNLALLLPFLDAPSIELKSLAALPRRRGERGPTVLRAEWRLRTGLRLPWRPAVDVDGATEYTLGEGSNLVVAHVETWEAGAWAALQQLFTPGGRG